MCVETIAVLVLCIFVNMLKYFISLPEISRKVLSMNIITDFNDFLFSNLF